MKKRLWNIITATFLLVCIGICGITGEAQAATSFGKIKKVRMTWDAVPNAVMYQLVITKGKSQKEKDIITEANDIYTLGYELNTNLIPVEKEDAHWKVRALDINHKPLSDFSSPKPLNKEEINTVKPLITGEYNKLPFAKVYPVYSWIPVAGASEYEIQVFKDQDNDPNTSDFFLRSYQVLEQRSSNYYDDEAYVAEGVYWWRIRAKDSNQMPIGQWSRKQYFKVKHDGVKIAALGDSITHGGGAVTMPPSYTMYDWETYTNTEILNLGYSGDTVEKMVKRFNRDVVPFSPQILVIMGGINNIRLDDKAEIVINGLNHLKYKCLFKNIVPVFVTITPVNPVAMKEVSNIPVSNNWMREQKKVNEWIKKQLFYVDVTEKLTDENGYLKSSLSVDGLHPDVDGKRIIGEAIGQYLQKEFPSIIK